ncbi:MAG TPA: YetF domain-containing protein [Pirellulales bacterium]|nr:YetF domain-containing protein [Pirellulales bacterium]
MLLADSMWHDMFYLALPVAEKILRSIVVYVFLILGVRLAGKRQLAQLNAFDLVVLLTLSNTVQNAIIGDDNSVTGGLVGAATLLLVNYVVVWYLYGHQKLDHLIEGDADVLISGGKIRRDRLRKELITESELEAAARRQGFGSLQDVDQAILEPGGTISLVARKPAPDEMRHGEIVMRLEEVLNEVRKLTTPPPKSQPA